MSDDSKQAEPLLTDDELTAIMQAAQAAKMHAAEFIDIAALNRATAKLI